MSLWRPLSIITLRMACWHHETQLWLSELETWRPLTKLEASDKDLEASAASHTLDLEASVPVWHRTLCRVWTQTSVPVMTQAWKASVPVWHRLCAGLTQGSVPVWHRLEALCRSDTDLCAGLTQTSVPVWHRASVPVWHRPLCRSDTGLEASDTDLEASVPVWHACSGHCDSVSRDNLT